MAMKTVSIIKKRRSMKRTLVMSVIVIHVAVLILSLYISYSVLLRTSKEQSVNEGVKNLDYMEIQLESLVSSILDIQHLIMQNKYILRQEAASQEITAHEIENKVETIRLFDQIISSYQYINSITFFRWDNVILNVGKIYSEQYTSVGSTFAIQDTNAIKAVSIDNNLVWGGVYNEMDLMNKGHSNRPKIEVVALLMPILDIWNSQSQSVISINIPRAFFDFLYGKDNSNVFLMGSQGEQLLDISVNNDSVMQKEYKEKILSDDLDGGNFSYKRGGNTYQVIYKKNLSTGWYLVEEISFDVLVHNAKKLQYIVGMTFTIAILVISIVSFMISSKMLVSYKKIAKSMNDIKEGDLSTRIPPMEYIELDVLTEKFNSMMVRIEKLIIENRQYESEKRDLEISTLQAQINPHFIYNSLTTIKWMASMARANNVCQAILALNNVLQPVFSQPGILWSINSEMNFVENYIDIMNYRFGGEIHSVYNFDDGIKDILVLRFILQPIVENSISHGLREQINGIIKITGVKTEKTLVIEVGDNGKGIDEEIQRKLTKSFMRGKREGNISEAHGFGLYNVNRRIKLHYGEDYGLSVRSVVNEGTVVTITLPIDK